MNKHGTLQYYHDQENGITYAVDVNFNKEDLLEAVHHFDKQTQFQVGCSFVHPNDVYTKSVGRELSSERLEPVLFKLNTIVNHTDKIYISFTSDSLHINFRVCNNSDKPHLISINRYEF